MRGRQRRSIDELLHDRDRCALLGDRGVELAAHAELSGAKLREALLAVAARRAQLADRDECLEADVRVALARARTLEVLFGLIRDLLEQRDLAERRELRAQVDEHESQQLLDLGALLL